MTLVGILPTVNAVLNATSGVLIVLGRRAIVGGDRTVHKRRMLSALAVSTLFFVSYGIRVALSGTHRFVGPAPLRLAYVSILLSHMILAALMVPMILTTFAFALRGRFDRHRRLARITWPIWLYVSITGVVVYVMLFHISGRL